MHETLFFMNLILIKNFIFIEISIDVKILLLRRTRNQQNELLKISKVCYRKLNIFK